MFGFSANVVAIEGPDCSGKTTLYNDIHIKTGFRWNIRDRSFLSTVCYARQYNRDVDTPRSGLEKEISNINNKIIVVLPPKDVIKNRLMSRGDEFQNESTILDLHEIFVEEAKKIEAFPNVLLIREEMSSERMAEVCISWLESFEKIGPIEIGRLVRDAAIAAGGEVSANVTASFHKSDNFSSVMQHPREGEYYLEILNQVIDIFRAEFCGENPYSQPQDLGSRRFYYSSSSCISSVHFLIRNGLLKVIAQMRSTDVHRNASIDLKFLCHLSSHVARHYDIPVHKIELLASFNCAHVRFDLPAWTKNEEIE